MKTTIDLADDLALTFKTQTKENGISMRSAIHEALRDWLRKNAQEPQQKKIPRDIGIVGGAGLTPEASEMAWDDIREISYGQ